MKPLLSIPTFAELRLTQDAMKNMIHRTPVLTNQYIDELVGGSVYFKCENFQKVGAFKMRGAASASLRLDEDNKKRGIATHSSGNHAQAVARAAQVLGIPAYIVMPQNAPKIKIEGTRSYGAEIIFCEPNQHARELTLAEVVNKTGAYFIHPYDNYDVIAGQASATLELLTDFPALDIIIAPVGGGGLLSGTALAAHYINPDLIVLGSEPKRVDDAFRSFRSGHIEKNERVDTIADGLRTTLGTLTLDLIKRHVTDILTVEEEEIVQAMRMIWERMKIIIEPSCAVPLAAILANKEIFIGKKTGVILTGGNVDLGNLPF
ncbi:MAG: threonine/serine dehydratase [Bacteroidetes bacterium]|nr:threonine/serine dehydratase [Bacteroidota bacterium]